MKCKICSNDIGKKDLFGHNDFLYSHFTCRIKVAIDRKFGRIFHLMKRRKRFKGQNFNAMIATHIFEFMNDIEVGRKVSILNQMKYSLLSIFFTTRYILTVIYDRDSN